MKLKALLSVLVVCCFASLGAGDTITLLDSGDGTDSGWSVEWLGDPDDPVKGVGDIDVVLNGGTPSSVTLTIEKDFGPPVGGEFRSAIMTFKQTAIDAAAKIIIRQESIDNSTGVSWTQFIWSVTPDGAAGMNQGESAWDVDPPFSTLTWSDLTTTGYHTLVASDGVVANGDTFSPAGGLVIDATVSDDPGDLTVFTLKQRVVPEPAAMTLLALGAVFGLRRGRKI